jgi:hypothetical protein
VLLWLNLLVMLAISPFMLVYIEVNKKWFGGGYGTLAICEVSFFVGVVLGSLALERLKIRRVGLAYVWGIVGVGIGVGLMAIAKSVLLFSLLNLAAGLIFPLCQIPITGYMQRLVPQDFQGRVNAAMSMASMGVQPLGIGLGGLALAAIGPSSLLALMGGGMALAGLLGLADKAFRKASV